MIRLKTTKTPPEHEGGADRGGSGENDAFLTAEAKVPTFNNIVPPEPVSAGASSSNTMAQYYNRARSTPVINKCLMDKDSKANEQVLLALPDMGARGSKCQFSRILKFEEVKDFHLLYSSNYSVLTVQASCCFVRVN